ncbi:MAG: GNAT family N-acetyltransferase [Patescibacteria group bacterium]
MFKIKEIIDPEECKNIWNELSPNESIYDNWDFRYCFHKYAPAPLHFFAGYLNDELIGLLPLEYINEEGGYLGYFAEEFMEENRLFIKPGREKYIPDFYDSVKGDIMIDDLSGEDAFTSGLPLEDYKYVLPLNGLKGFKDHLEKSFSSKRRRQFLKVNSEIEKNGIKIIHNNYDDIDLLFELNIKRHGKESYLSEPHKKEIFKDLASLFKVEMLTAEISGKKQGVSYSILHNGVYNYLSVGANLTGYSSLGAYIGMKNIDYAILSGARVFDAGLGDCGWKHLWHFDRVPQYSLARINNQIRY